MNRRDLFKVSAALPVASAAALLVETAKPVQETKMRLLRAAQYGVYVISTDEIMPLNFDRAERAYKAGVSLYFKYPYPYTGAWRSWPVKS